MRMLAYGPLFLVATLITAEATPLSPGVPAQLLQGGALAVLAWTIYYGIAKVLPAHAEAMRKQREDFLKALQQDREDRREFQRFVESVMDDRAQARDCHT